MECFCSGWESLVIKTSITPIAYYIKRCCQKDITNELIRYGIELFSIEIETHKIRVSYRSSTANGSERDLKKTVVDTVLKMANKVCVIPLIGFNCKWSNELLSSDIEYSSS